MSSPLPVDGYRFSIQDNGPDLDIIITRTLLALAAFVCFFYRREDYYYLNIAAGILLGTAAVFIKTILLRYRVNRLVPLIVAAALILGVTGSVSFAVIIVLYGVIFPLLNKKPSVQVNAAGIHLQRFVGIQSNPWTAFNNVIIKDNLLTLDFKTNKILQLIISEEIPADTVSAFNHFCLEKTR